MRISRISADGRPRCAALQGDTAVELTAPPWESGTPTGESWSIADVSFLPPLPDARLFCIGLNYPKPHPLGGFVAGPAHISYFIKHQAALVAHGEALQPPGVSEQFDYECELAVVIGRPGHRIAEAAAMQHVAGYTILNDGSVRDWQAHSVTAGKNFGASGSWGPCIVTADEVPDWRALRLLTRLNGATVQDSPAGAMFFGVPRLIAYLSTITPLIPGDVIATGSPEGTGATQKPPRFLRSGDQLEFEIQPIGVLANSVA